MESQLTDYQASLVTWNGVLLVAGLAAAAFSGKRFDVRWFLIATALFNINVALVLDFFDLNRRLYALAGSPDVQFNWAGKFLALIFSVLILLTPLIDRREAGVTFRQSRKSYIGWTCLGLLCAINIYIALKLDNQLRSAEAIAYQLTMPSLEEEVFHRGVLLFALTKAFGDGPRIVFAHFGWGAMLSVLIFAMIHALFWAGGGLVFSAEAFAFAGFFGLLLTWLRLNTGSILAPLFLHSAINTIWRVL